MTNAVVWDYAGLLLKDDLGASEVLALRKQAFSSREARAALKEFVSKLESGASGAKQRTALAAAYWAQGWCDRALEIARAEKSSEVAQFVAAKCLLARGMPDEAAATLRTAAGKTKCAEVHATLAEALRRQGQHQAAAQAVKEGLQKAGDNAALLAQAGILADMQGDTRAAEECYRKALELDGTNVEALFRLAYQADLHGDNDTALEYYRRCIQVKPVRSRALMNLGLLYEEMGREAEAYRCFEMVHDRHPVNLRARLYLKDAEASKDMFFDEEQQKRRERRNKVLETPISDFELSVRSRNCLEKMNVRTVGDLTRITETELLAFKNFGETSLNEIKQMMTSKGLRLGQALEGEEGKPTAKVKGLRKKTIDHAKVLARSVDDLGLSVRSQHCMQILGVNTIGDLVAKSEKELMEARNFGSTSLTEVKKKLATYGLTLAQ